VRNSPFARTLSACVAFLIFAPCAVNAATCIGTKIHTPQLNVTNSLNAVFAPSPNQAWVGGSSSNGPFLYGWDGSRWKRQRLAARVSAVSEITGLSSSDVWLAGSGYSQSCCSMAVHYDGNVWDPEPPNYFSNGYNDLNSIVDFAPNDVWAAGDDWEYGCYGCPPVDFDFLVHWDGTHWTHDSFTGNYVGLVAISGVSKRDMWVLEQPSFDRAGSSVAAWHRIGGPFSGNWTSWQIKSTERFTFLTALAVVSSTDIWAVGGQASSHRDPGRPFIVHWDGQGWSIVPGPTGVNGESFSSVAAIASDDVWAVGGGAQGSIVEHWDGSSWTRVRSQFANKFSSAAVIPGTNEVWAVGSNPDPVLKNVSVAAVFPC